jgi:hypothetical protein
MAKKGPERPRGIVWKGNKTPEEVERLNKEAAEARGLTRRGGVNREKPLEGIDPTLIAAMQQRAVWIRGAVSHGEREEAELHAPNMVRAYPPKKMIQILDGVRSTKTLSTDPVFFASLAIAFLHLTEMKGS